MTKEEAIENLKGCVCGYEVGKDGKPNGNVTADLTRETIDMAIKALETPPNDNWEGYSKRLWKNAYERGKADAEQRWIPVSERLPEVGSEVLVCFDFKGKRSVYISNFYGDGEFHGLDDEYLTPDGRRHRKAVAWMPLPEPYKAESEDKLDGDPVDIDKAVEHYDGTLETLKGIGLEVDG